MSVFADGGNNCKVAIFPARECCPGLHTGVRLPITFIGSYNPSQFEILGIMKKGEPSQGMTYTKDKKEVITLLDLIDGEEIETNMFTQPSQIVKGPSIDGVNKYVRLIIQRKKTKEDK